ncbi:MAG: hypothetical protein ABII12_16160 [Planctomycetota bacterium]
MPDTQGNNGPPISPPSSTQHPPQLDNGQAPRAEPRNQGTLADIAHQGSLVDIATLVFLILGGVILAIILVILGKRSFGTGPERLIPLGTGAVLAAVVAMFMRRVAVGRRKRELRQWLLESPELPSAERVKRLVESLCVLNPYTWFADAVRLLAAEQPDGTTIRIAPPAQLTKIDPILVHFEPQRFDELAAAGDQIGPPPTPDALPDKQSTMAPRGIRRNIILKGGWLIVAVYLFNWAMAVFDAILRRSVTLPLVGWSAGLVFILLIPVGGLGLAEKQWLAVPGGIIFRKSAWLKRRWTVHVFDRRASVLLAYRMRTRAWFLIVGDASACERTLCTKHDLEAALRAWLSPLPPPKPVQLTDFQ